MRAVNWFLMEFEAGFCKDVSRFNDILHSFRNSISKGAQRIERLFFVCYS